MPDSLQRAPAQTAAPDLIALLAAVHADIRPAFGSGKVADYIPALARVDPRQFGLAIVMCSGEAASVGDAKVPFSIQSISKVFTLALALALALGRLGHDLWRHVGREPSGSPFNSVVQLERELGIPRNPLINAGAIVVTDSLLAGRPPQALIDELLGVMQDLAIAPRRAAIAVWSPGLNANGNSLVGALALESLARRTGWSVF